MSTLFEPRTPDRKTDDKSESIVAKHIQLCNRVLKLYRDFASDERSCISAQTFQVLLKTSLGIADVLLCKPTVKQSLRQKGHHDDNEEVALAMIDNLWSYLFLVSVSNL